MNCEKFHSKKFFLIGRELKICADATNFPRGNSAVSGLQKHCVTDIAICDFEIN